MNIMLLMMGGGGTRFHNIVPKQYTKINGIPLFLYILKKAETQKEIDAIIVVSHSDYITYTEEWIRKFELKKVKKVIAGGSTRSLSVKNGLAAAKGIATGKDVVLIHDATHPYLDEKSLQTVIKAAEEYGGATCVSANYDTVYQVDENGMLQCVAPREKIVAGASPEVFQLQDIYNVYCSMTKEELERLTSAGATALANGIQMKAVPIELLNLKITYQRDFTLFCKLVNNYFFENMKWTTKKE